MKKIILLISLVCFSFYYTDKVINLINNKNPLMIKINENKINYEVKPVGGVINDNTIIPGIKGKEVDIDKSYEEMKLGGIFREEELIYKDILPTNSLSNNKDKYIIKGNNINKNVSLLFILNNNDINTTYPLTLFVNHNKLNTKLINKYKNYEIYSYGNNGVYNSEILTSDNSLINNLSNNKSTYCLTKEKNNNLLKICNENNMYTVIPTLVGNYSDIKDNLTNGSIILLTSLDNLDIICKYIEGKGYNIVPLSVLLKE